MAGTVLIVLGLLALPLLTGFAMLTAEAAGGLGIALSVAPDPMVIGDSAVYTVTVTNTAAVPASDVTVSDTLSADVTLGALPAGCSASGRVFTCGGTGVTVGPGGTLTYQIPVTVNASVSDGTNIINQASVTTSAPGVPGSSARLVSVTRTLTDIEVTKSAPAAANPDGTITYTITVTNHGPSNAVTVTVQDPTNGNLTTITQLPSQCPASGLTVSCPLGTLTPTESRTFQFTVKVNPGVAAGTTITNCATVYTGSREENTVNNSSCTQTVFGPPVFPPVIANISVQKFAPSTTTAGGVMTYRMVVTNDGPDDAANVSVHDAVDTTVDSILTVPSGCDDASRTVTCHIGTLAAGDSRTIDFDVKVKSGLSAGILVPNCAVAATDVTDPDLEGNTSCVNSVVEPSPTPTPTPTPSESQGPSTPPTRSPSPPVSRSVPPTPSPPVRPPVSSPPSVPTPPPPTPPILPVTGAPIAQSLLVSCGLIGSGLLLRGYARRPPRRHAGRHRR
jgi:uncharacterized repeat protein (TIGR01451 family)